MYKLRCCVDKKKMNEKKSKVSYQDVQKKYKDTRTAVHKATAHTLREKFQALQLTAITERAHRVVEKNWTLVPRLVDWDWRKQQAYWKKKRPRYWEMAIWHKAKLCGLVIGVPTRGKTRLYIEGIEGSPTRSDPLSGKIMQIALFASERYAEALGCQEIWIVDPAEGLLDAYKKLGYNVRPPNQLGKLFRMSTYAIKSMGVI
jgi:hypothetical protein